MPGAGIIICCNGSVCTNPTGCEGANTLCTGRRFVIPTASASASGSYAYNQIDDLDGDPFEFFQNSGTYSSNTTVTISPKHSLSASISISGAAALAIMDTGLSATFYGSFYSASVGGSSTSFNATSGGGVTISLSISQSLQGAGTWVTSDGDYTIENYQFQTDSSEYFSEEEWFYSITVTYNPTTQKFIYSIGYSASLKKSYDVRRSHTWREKFDNGVGGVWGEYFFASGSTAAANVSISGSITGQSDSVSGSCAGDSVTFDIDSSPFTYPPPTFADPDVTEPSGTATAHLDTGAWTEAQAGCRDCPRYLEVSGTITHVRKGGAIEDATISARLVMLEVAECGRYRCQYATRDDAPGTITFADSSTVSVGVTLGRDGPSLWALGIDTIEVMQRNTLTACLLHMKFGGSCPTGSPTIRQQWTQYTYTVDPDPRRLHANHQWGTAGDPPHAFDGWVMTTPLGLPDPEARDEPVDTSDIGSMVITGVDGRDIITSHSLSFTEVERETGDPTYFCEGATKWNTGEESDGETGEDLHWTVENANESGVFVPAYVQTDNEFLVYYATPIATAAWIGIDEHGSYYGGIRRYRTTITVEGTLADDITGNVSSDNQTLAIYVNGTLRVTTPTPATNDSQDLKHAFTLDKTWFTTGINTVDFEVNDNVDSEPHANGLLVEWDD